MSGKAMGLHIQINKKIMSEKNIITKNISDDKIFYKIFNKIEEINKITNNLLKLEISQSVHNYITPENSIDILKCEEKELKEIFQVTSDFSLFELLIEENKDVFYIGDNCLVINNKKFNSLYYLKYNEISEIFFEKNGEYFCCKFENKYGLKKELSFYLKIRYLLIENKKVCVNINGEKIKELVEGKIKEYMKKTVIDCI